MQSTAKLVGNKSLVLAKTPIAFPIVGEDLVVKSTRFDLEQAPPEGGLILKTNYVSYDPYMRGRSEFPLPQAKKRLTKK